MNNQKLILAIETALREPSLSLLRGVDEIGYWNGTSQISSSEVLLPAISALLRDNQLSLSNLDTIAVSKGPGSFTGIRVGLATAAALSLAAHKKCCGVSLLEALALIPRYRQKLPEQEETTVLTVIAAGHHQVYWQAFSSTTLKSKFEPRLDSYAAFFEKSDITNFHNHPNYPDLIIVADKGIVEEISTKLNESVSNLINAQHIEIIAASDNVARLIGLKLFNFQETELVEHAESPGLAPFYMRDVRIGQ